MKKKKVLLSSGSRSWSFRECGSMGEKNKRNPGLYLKKKSLLSLVFLSPSHALKNDTSKWIQVPWFSRVLTAQWIRVCALEPDIMGLHLNSCCKQWCLSFLQVQVGSNNKMNTYMRSVQTIIGTSTHQYTQLHVDHDFVTRE